MTKYKTYREVRNTFSPESQKRIAARAEQIKEELRILRTVREMAGVSQEELAERLDVKQPYISQLEGRENITLSTLVGVISALGGSVDIVINFPEQEPVCFAEIETVFSSQLNEN
ncbi:MAG: helix-turn-helix transcriptional regulator [Symploca sp. SIO2E6]|nr:helix-turn-helix transcriptional regulator [Symploca sp. SIO2E6]